MESTREKKKSINWITIEDLPTTNIHCGGGEFIQIIEPFYYHHTKEKQNGTTITAAAADEHTNSKKKSYDNNKKKKELAILIMKSKLFWLEWEMQKIVRFSLLHWF